MIQINGWPVPDTSPAALLALFAVSQCSPRTVLHLPILTQGFEFLKFQLGHPAQVKALPVTHTIHRYGDFVHAVEVHLVGLELKHIVPI